jgi:hypothetical protein
MVFARVFVFPMLGMPSVMAGGDEQRLFEFLAADLAIH